MTSLLDGELSRQASALGVDFRVSFQNWTRIVRRNHRLRTKRSLVSSTVGWWKL
jgi:hypothetical protein